MLWAHLQAADTSVPSACFLIRVCGWVFLIRIKAALRAILPGGLAPCISISFPP